MPNNRTNAHQSGLELQAELNRTEAVKLKVQGWSEREIARKLGVSKTAVHGYLDAEREDARDVRADYKDRFREMEFARMSALLQKVMPLATQDGLVTAREDRDGGIVYEDAADIQLKATAQAIKISERISKLFGLDAPAKVEQSGPNGGPIAYTLTEERRAQLTAKAERVFAALTSNN